jgi:hypothetical protein
MTLESGKIQMAKLARLRHRAAELHGELAETLAEEAKIYDELAEGQSVDLRTGKMRAKYRKVELPTNITAEERASAVDALRGNDMRRRAAR